ncbi:zinc ABC transporter substrate-binding protein [Virgibacillus sp. 179-BFC.A HS]|uniref:Zinc ABC transporter substrate-binding protein n=1 Tax=Tigheibacillus jepli TaxID=3035914 RepID=A0ABU5CFZ2_9BACI|nr:zinc ABC transporter substrate-binding protein [Virgibacillus sp. 179-BFC.A HS]MDY0405223.1 zinc ABC transporter substrate-binding protein [Virgibacillus sp. 179-BFC.A HS]
MREILNNKITLMIFILIAFLLVSACGNESGKTKKHTLPLKVYTTIAPLSDFAKRIGGDDVEVQSILPPGVDAHTFEPTSKQIVEIAKADSFIYNGLGMESYAVKIADSLKGEDVLILQAAKNVSTVKGETHEDEHDHGDNDPHVWLDPIRAITIAENIKDALIQLHPDGKQLYEKNFNALKDDLKDLDHEFRKLTEAKKIRKWSFPTLLTVIGKTAMA